MENIKVENKIINVAFNELLKIQHTNSKIADSRKQIEETLSGILPLLFTDNNEVTIERIKGIISNIDVLLEELTYIESCINTSNGFITRACDEIETFYQKESSTHYDNI